MESHKSTQLKVGVFITIGLFVILASIFMLGADRAIFKKYVRLHSYFSEVQGLAEGSVVSLSGITVGNIEEINFIADKNLVDVVLKIEFDYAKKMSKHTQVEIRTQGALGDKYIFLIPGDPQAGTVADGDTIEVAAATDILSILAARGSETGKVFDIINDLSRMTKSMLAEGRMEKIMHNLSQASNNLSTASSDAKRIFGDLNAKNSGQKMQQSIEHFSSIMAKIDRGEGSLGALINDPSLHNQLKALLGGSPRKNNLKSIIRTSIEKEPQ